MSTEPSLASLQQELTELRRELRELQTFFQIQRDDTPEAKAVALHLTCTTLELVHPSAPDDVQGRFVAEADGPSLVLRDNQLEACLELSAASEPMIRLFDKTDELALELAIDPETNRGQVAVFDHGKPRALMKSTDQGGGLSVVNDGGKVRACMIGSDDGGAIYVVNAQDKTNLKLSAEAVGGMLTVNDPQGRPVIGLLATEEKGSTWQLLRPDGTIAAACMNNPDGVLFLLQSDDDGKDRLSFQVIKDSACLRLNGANRKLAVELSAHEHGGGVRLCDHAGDTRLNLHVLKEGPLMSFTNRNAKHEIALSALDSSAMLSISSPAQGVASLFADEDNLSLHMRDAEKNHTVLLNGTSNSPALLLHPNASSWPVAGFMTNEIGGVCVLSDFDGTRRAGMAANQSGGMVALYNDLGIQRVELGCADDGGLLKLNWGGNIGVSALATHQGGAVLVNDANGELRDSLPDSGADDDA